MLISFWVGAAAGVGNKQYWVLCCAGCFAVLGALLCWVLCCAGCCAVGSILGGMLCVGSILGGMLCGFNTGWYAVWVQYWVLWVLASTGVTLLEN